jgi:hypothetical protein
MSDPRAPGSFERLVGNLVKEAFPEENDARHREETQAIVDRVWQALGDAASDIPGPDEPVSAVRTGRPSGLLSSKTPRPGVGMVTQNLLRKILISCAAGAGTYAAVTLFEKDNALALMLSGFVAATTLVVQFLLVVEARRGSVDDNITTFSEHQRELTKQLEISVKTQLERFNQANSLLTRLDAGPLGRQLILELAQYAAEVDQSAPSLAHRLAESEISKLSAFLKDLGRGHEVTADYEGWDWIFTLTSSVQQTIDATSYIASGDNKANSLWDDNIWTSEQAQRYLNLQAQAIERGISIRRIFILETPKLADHPDLHRICDDQSARGIDVRLIDAETATASARGQVPLVIFDQAICLELMPSRFPAATARHVKIALTLNPFQVHQRLEMFERLWLHCTKTERPTI